MQAEVVASTETDRGVYNIAHIFVDSESQRRSQDFQKGGGVSFDRDQT